MPFVLLSADLYWVETRSWNQSQVPQKPDGLKQPIRRFFFTAHPGQAGLGVSMLCEACPLFLGADLQPLGDGLSP